MSEDVLVAIIATVGVIGAAGFGTLGMWLSSVKKSLGDAGDGNVSGMLVQLLDGQAHQNGRLAKLEAGQSRHNERITRVEQTLSTLAD